MSNSVRPQRWQPTRLFCPWDSPGKNTGVGAISFYNSWEWKVKVKLLSRVRLHDPMDCSPPGSSIHGIFQARILEWGAITFSGLRLTISKYWVSEVTQSCLTLCDPMNCSRLLHPWDFPSKNTGVDCHLLLQEIFPTQRLNPGLLHCRQTLYPLSHQGSLMWRLESYKLWLTLYWKALL